MEKLAQPISDISSSLEKQSDQRKVDLLLHHLGPESLSIFNSFNEDIDTVKYDDLIAKWTNYFVPKKNIAMERHKFFSRKQTERTERND